MADPIRYAPLSARMIRRTPTLRLTDQRPAWQRAPIVDREEGGWRADLRLFLFTWAAGFVFFLTLLA